VCIFAGGLFHFKKDEAQHSLKPKDYATKPLFVASKDNRFLNDFFLYVLVFDAAIPAIAGDCCTLNVRTGLFRSHRAAGPEAAGRARSHVKSQSRRRTESARPCRCKSVRSRRW